MSDTLEPPSPRQLRAELEEMVRRDLLGPADGPREEVDELHVRSRYIVGMLAPRGQSILPDEQGDDLAARHSPSRHCVAFIVELCYTGRGAGHRTGPVYNVRR
jgi:hypothetical protein